MQLMPIAYCHTPAQAAPYALICPSHMTTQGWDVIEYYACLGHSARVKMFHAARADLTGTDCPYELVVMAKVGEAAVSLTTGI